MGAVLANGFKATVTLADGRSISRESLHPELAYERVLEWVQSQRDFADKRGFIITARIEPITGKRIDTE